jgi:hypothetical protein
MYLAIMLVRGASKCIEIKPVVGWMKKHGLAVYASCNDVLRKTSDKVPGLTGHQQE